MEGEGLRKTSTSQTKLVPRSATRLYDPVRHPMEMKSKISEYLFKSKLVVRLRLLVHKIGA